MRDHIALDKRRESALTGGEMVTKSPMSESPLNLMELILSKENLPQRYGGTSTLWPLPKIPQGSGAEQESVEDTDDEIMT